MLSSRWSVLVCLVFSVVATTAIPADAAAEEESGPPPEMSWETDEGLIEIWTWHQGWGRAMQFNPGTELGTEETDAGFDAGMRRMRFLWLAEYRDFRMVFHFGADNQTFVDDGASLGVLDAWGEYELVDEALAVGGGLHYWMGISRLTRNASASALALDPPVLNWPTIGQTDRVARQLGVFAKGQVGPVGYNVALNRPFIPPAGVAAIGEGTDFNEQANTWASTGYVDVALMEPEGNDLPFAPGTRLGAQPVLNLGLGWYRHPDSMAEIDADGDRTAHDMLAVGADVFWEQPLDNGASLTNYLALYHYDMGPDYVRNIGVMNIGQGGTELNGPGVAYPAIGTGNHAYLQSGFLLPGQLGGVQVQPYVAGQLSAMEALEDPVMVGNVGANWYVYGHTAKVTTHYRNRPVFDTDGVADSRAGEFIVQMQFFL